MKKTYAGFIVVLFCQTLGPACKPQVRSATFEARHEFKFTPPEGAKKLRAWLAMPQPQDANQDVRDFKVESSVPHRIERDSEGNAVLYVEMESPKAFTVVERFTLTRREQRNELDPAKTRPITDEERRKYAKDLEANANVVINDEIRSLASSIVGTEKNPILAARKLYDWTLDNIEYWVKYPDRLKASPVGSTTYCLANKTGNCTDFHSLWASLARAAGIPTRIVYGGFFKKELDGVDKDQSYHCWLEFYAPNYGWVPHDVAVADLYHNEYAIHDGNDTLVRLTSGDGAKGRDAAKVDYFFGSIDERRVVWSRGRDLILSPRQDGGPVNALPKAYVEIDGQVAAEGKAWTRKLTYREIK